MKTLIALIVCLTLLGCDAPQEYKDVDNEFYTLTCKEVTCKNPDYEAYNSDFSETKTCAWGWRCNEREFQFQRSKSGGDCFKVVRTMVSRTCADMNKEN